MYEKFFYLKEKPFHITPDSRFLYLGSKHKEAIDLMRFGITGRKGFVLLTGEVGTGKTTLCRALLERLPRSVESALILNPLLTEFEILKTITADFGLDVKGPTSKAHLDALNSFLIRTTEAGGNAVVIIDEAQNLCRGAMEMLRLLSNLETEKEKLLQIVMVGQPELRSKLGMRELRQLNQRVIIRHHLDPLDAGETGAYINTRLQIAGGDGNIGFTSEAVRSIHGLSGGIPRMINIICDRALTAAFVCGRRSIDLGLVRRAGEELEREGYIPPGRLPLALSLQRAIEPAYARYMPHIALSAFTLALIAGMLWGHHIFENTSLVASIP